jgi:hypothetical protein
MFYAYSGLLFPRLLLAGAQTHRLVRDGFTHSEVATMLSERDIEQPPYCEQPPARTAKACSTIGMRFVLSKPTPGYRLR